MKILLAVDGSPHSLDTVKSVIEHADWYRDKPAIELITVHRPVPKIGGLGAAVSKAQVDRYYEEEGAKALGAAKKALDGAGLRYEARVLVGDPPEVIVKHAKSAGCDLICIGTPANWLGTTANKVLRLAETPVMLVK
jgi:nucleotide-binding universal stress UspA family protein